MTKMAVMPIYGKNLKKSSPEPKGRWYAALGAQVLQNLFKWWPWVDFDLFYGKVKFGPLCFCMGKRFVCLFVCLCWGLMFQSTIFQSGRDGATASWVINQYFWGVKCLAQGHNTGAVGLEPPTSRYGVRHTTTEPPRSPGKKIKQWIFQKLL